MDLFISYSRQNSDFVKRLHQVLEAQPFEIWVDWQNVPFTVDWWDEIKRGIEDANNFVFVVSMASFTSPVCHLELAHAIQHNKRLIPIIRGLVDEVAGFADLAARKLDDHTLEALAGRDIIALARTNWLAIARHNWLFFVEEPQFAQNIQPLIDAIRTDFDLVRQHTRFLRRALTWRDEQHRQSDYLLNRAEWREAKAWLDKSDAEEKIPKPTALHREYIEQSGKCLRRRRYLTVLRGAGGAAVMLAASTIIVLTTQSPTQKDKIIPMEGKFNILVADFAMRAESGMESSADADWLASSVVSDLNQLKNETPDLERSAIRYGNIGVVEGLTRADRADSAARLAALHGADMVIYGFIDPRTLPAQFYAEFYIAPRLVGAEEATGEEAFGAPIEVPLPLADDAAHRIVLLNALEPRLEALVQFIYGLAFVNARQPEKALAQFETARQVADWHDEDGKEILYLWMGTALNEIGRQRVFCVLSDPPGDRTGLQCAEVAFRRALAINPLFARAHIGLSNVLLDQAERQVAGTTVTDCNMYELAADGYAQALVYADQAEPSAHLELKVFYNTGLAYATAARNPVCSNSAVIERAIQALTHAVAIYGQDDTTIPLVRQLGFRSYYQLGLTYSIDKQYASAIEAFSAAINLAMPHSAVEEDWQTQRWTVYNQRGYAHFCLAEEGESEHYDFALADYEALLTTYHNQRYADATVVADAALHAGLVYEATGQPDAARTLYQEVVSIPDAPANLVTFAESRLKSLNGDSHEQE